MGAGVAGGQMLLAILRQETFSRLMLVNDVNGGRVLSRSECIICAVLYPAHDGHRVSSLAFRCDCDCDCECERERDD